MKLEKYFLLLALGVFAFALQSCDDDDNDGISVRPHKFNRYRLLEGRS